MVFAAYEFVQKRAERKGRQEGLQEGLREGLQEGLQKGQELERERIARELASLVSNGDGDAIVSPEDIERITRPNQE